MKKIRIIWHFVELNGWQQVADQQWDLIVNSDLINKVDEISVCGNGQPWTFTNWIATKNNPKLKFYNVNSSAAFHEYPTLNFMYEVSKAATEPFYICYLHLKGLTRWGDVNVGDWRDFMNWANIERWQDNITALDNGADVVGTNYNTVPWPHFSGNFWWAKSEYIATLDILLHPEFKLARNGTQFTPHPTNPHWRFDHEAWVHSKNPKYFELAKSLEPGDRHYRERYPSENYR